MTTYSGEGSSCGTDEAPAFSAMLQTRAFSVLGDASDATSPIRFYKAPACAVAMVCPSGHTMRLGLSRDAQSYSISDHCRFPFAMGLQRP